MGCTSEVGSPPIFRYITGMKCSLRRVMLPPTLSVTFGLLFMVAMSGCSSTQSRDAVFTREILTAEEIVRTPALNAYEAVQMRRPAFLARANRRALREADQPDARPIVYVNGVYFGDVDSLRDIPVRQIKDIRFMEANDATRTLGTTNVGGVILVTTNLN